jgi:hypothetical protein
MGVETEMSSSPYIQLSNAIETFDELYGKWAACPKPMSLRATDTARARPIAQAAIDQANQIMKIAIELINIGKQTPVLEERVLSAIQKADEINLGSRAAYSTQKSIWMHRTIYYHIEKDLTPVYNSYVEKKSAETYSKTADAWWKLQELLQRFNYPKLQREIQYKYGPAMTRLQGNFAKVLDESAKK